jgi:hypothetical protein
MGDCMSETTQNRSNQNDNKIPITVQRIRITLEQQLMKREKSFYEQEKMLWEQFSKDPVQRSLNTERALINQTVYYKNITQSN